MESDYVATCAVYNNTWLIIDRLELQGLFEEEYDKKSEQQKELIFKQIIIQLKSVVSDYVPPADKVRAV